MLKNKILPIFGLWLSTQVWGADIQQYITQLESDDYEARKMARVELSQAIAEAEGAERAAMEADLIAVIDDAHSFAVRQWSIRVLELFGSEASVLPLAQLLIDSDPNIRDAARMALQLNDSAQATAVLENAVRKGLVEDKPGYVDALAYRGAPSSVPVVAALLDADDETLAQLAATALGEIGGDAAVRALVAKHASAAGDLKERVELALVDCELTDARLATSLAQSGVSTAIRYAAFTQLMQLDSAKASDLLAAANTDAKSWMLPAAMQSASLQAAVVKQLSMLSEADQIVVLGTIQDSALSQYETEIWPLLGAESKAVVDKAAETLGLVGTDKSFEKLYAFYQKNTGNEAAKTAMVHLKAPAADAQLLANAKSGSADEKLSAIKLLTLRNSPGALELMNQIAKGSSDAKLRQAAFKSLELIGTIESVQILLDVILEGGASTRAAQGSLKKLSVSMAKASTLWRNHYQPALKSAGSDAQKKSILVILDGVSCGAAAGYLQGLITSNSSLRSDALRSLSRWSDVSAGAVWLKLMSAPNASDADIAAAQKGIKRILSQKSVAGSEAAKSDLAAKAVQQSPDAAFKDVVLSVYEGAKLGHKMKRALRKSFKTIQDDPDVGERVKAFL